MQILATKARVLVDPQSLVQRVPIIESLPLQARLVLGTRLAVIVLPGAVTDKEQLSLTEQVRWAIGDSASDYGPFGVKQRLNPRGTMLWSPI